MELTVYDCFCADSCCMRRLWEMSLEPMLGPGLPIPTPSFTLLSLSGDITYCWFDTKLFLRGLWAADGLPSDKLKLSCTYTYDLASEFIFPAVRFSVTLLPWRDLGVLASRELASAKPDVCGVAPR